MDSTQVMVRELHAGSGSLLTRLEALEAGGGGYSGAAPVTPATGRGPLANLHVRIACRVSCPCHAIVLAVQRC